MGALLAYLAAIVLLISCAQTILAYLKMRPFLPDEIRVRKQYVRTFAFVAVSAALMAGADYIQNRIFAALGFAAISVAVIIYIWQTRKKYRAYLE